MRRSIAVIRLFLALTAVSWASCNMAEAAEPEQIRVASWNVEYGSRGTPEQIAQLLQTYNLDVIGFCEVPDGDWTARVGAVLSMPYSYVGSISSAGHADKYKSILSRTPLVDTAEYSLSAWSDHASVVRAKTTINGITVAVYETHIPAGDTDSVNDIRNVLSDELTENILLMGDFNSHIGSSAMNLLEQSSLRPTWDDLNINLDDERTGSAVDPEDNWGVIDHVFYMPGADISVDDGGIIYGTELSDHYPVWTSFDVSQSPEPGTMSLLILGGFTLLRRGKNR